MDSKNKSPLVLIVDDRPVNLKIISEILKPYYGLSVATSGPRAIEIASSDTPPDLILLDIMMPEMNGYEVCKILKNDQRTHDIPVIFLTARNSPEDETKGFEHGAVDYITKPFSPLVVRARVKTHLEFKQHRDHLEELVQARTAELQKAKITAEAANRAKSQFLANVSHEFNTPLTSMLGFAEIVRKKLNKVVLPAIQGDEGKPQKTLRQVGENVDIVISEGIKLATLINNVLDISRIEAGTIKLSTHPLSLAEVIESAIATTNHLFQEKDLTLTHDIENDLPQIIGDRQRLIQVLVNLLTNAAKFTQEGTVKCTVKKTGNQIAVTVEDTGIGIDRSDWQRIFDIFAQAGDGLTNKPKGSGIGLPLCKYVIEHHGGKIWVDSVLGQGSTFSFTLPLTQDV